MNNRFKLITSGYLFLIKENEVLLSRRYNTGYEDGKYSVPAGHLESHETIRSCTSRESFEEIGIQILPDDLELIHVMHRKGTDERIDFFFTAKKWKGNIVNKEPKKCDDLQWFDLSHLPGNTIPYIRFAIEAYQKNVFYSEFGWI